MPMIQSLIGGAQGLYDQGGLQGHVLAPQSQLTQQAQDAVLQKATGGPSLGEQAGAGIGGILAQGGIAAGSQPIIDQMQQAALNGGTPGNQAILQQLMSAMQIGGTPGNQAILQQLTNTALGGDMGGNPYWQQLLDTQAGRLTDNLNRGFSGSGRYGSYAHGQTVGDQVGQMRLSAMNTNYEQERARQLQAAQMATGLNQQDFANRMSAGQAAAGLNQQDFANRMGAGQAALGANQQGIANMFGASQMAPGLDQAGMFNANLLAQLGGVQDQRAQTEYTDQRSKPLQNLQMLGAFGMPIAQLGGTQDSTSSSTGSSTMSGTTTQSQVPNPWQTAIGLGLGGAAMLGGIPTGGFGMFGGGGGTISGTPGQGTYAAGLPWAPQTQMGWGQLGAF